MTRPPGDSEPPRSRDPAVVAGRYHLDRVLGAGSFGRVWSADDVVTGRRVAVKLLHPQVELGQSRAQLEILALRQKLPGVVELLDEGSEDGQLFLVMELVDGRPFPGIPVPCAWHDVADVVVALLSTLGLVHAAFVIHRDLKPANVLVSADGQVRLLDFGVAYQPSGVTGDSEDGLEIVGTPAYMAPEQLRRQPLSERTDIYALGWMLYEALAGELPPKKGQSPAMALWARLNQPATPLLEVAPSVPANVARLVDRMIALDPNDRPASAFDVLAALRGEKAVLDLPSRWLGSRAVLGDGAEARVRPLEEAELRSLFVGPDRLLHLREDAARLLHERTGGVPGRVARELASWIHLGVARPVRDLLAVARPALERLAAGLVGGELPSEEQAVFESLDARARDVLVWATLASPGATAELLAEVSGSPPGDVRADIEALAALGLVAALPDGRIAVRAPLSKGAWPEARIREAHAVLAAALPAGSPGRVQHLVLAGAGSVSGRLSIAREAAALATRHLAEGHPGAAVASIEAGLRAVQRLRRGAAVETATLFCLWAEAALEEGAPHAVDRLLHSLYRAEDHPTKGVVQTLAHASKVEEFASERALSLARSVPPQPDPRLERLRLRVLLNAARLRRDDAAEEALFDELSASPAAADRESAARIEHARGRLRYRQGRYAEAAAHHAAAAARSPSVLLRIEATNAAAWALIEAFDLDRALALAKEALALSASHRHALQETCAEWSLRAIAYRRGSAGRPDEELLLAAQQAAGRQLHGSVAFIEAAAAWRAGSAEAKELARQSHHLLAAIDEKRGALLMRCLLLHLGEEASPVEVRALHRTALSFRGSGIGLQALALLAGGGCLLDDLVTDEVVAELVAETPQEHRSTPADILSVEEALAMIRRARPRPPDAGGLNRASAPRTPR